MHLHTGVRVDCERRAEVHQLKRLEVVKIEVWSASHLEIFNLWADPTSWMLRIAKDRRDFEQLASSGGSAERKHPVIAHRVFRVLAC